MSSEYAVQFVPEEHAPDPVRSHGDPTLPGKVGIWLFLASEIMFFAAILGSYVVYRGGAPAFFAKNAETLNKVLAGVNTVVLILSSLTMALAVDAAQKGNAKKAARCLGLTVLCAFAFLGIKFFEYKAKFQHETFQVVMTAPSGAGGTAAETPATRPATQEATPATRPVTDEATDATAAARATPPAAAAPKPKRSIMLYDGHLYTNGAEWTFTGYIMPMDEKKPFDLHLVTETDFKRAKAPHVVDQKVDPATVTNTINYGPWRNVFFSSYFTLTGIHGLHVIGGIIPLGILLVQAGLRGKVFPRHTEYVGLYWHFVDLVWIFLFPLLYLI